MGLTSFLTLPPCKPSNVIYMQFSNQELALSLDLDLGDSDHCAILILSLPSVVFFSVMVNDVGQREIEEGEHGIWNTAVKYRRKF